MESNYDKKMCAIRGLASQFENLDLELIEVHILVQSTFEQIRVEAESWLMKFDLNRAKFLPLAMLFTSDDKRMKPSEIAEHAGVSRATMTGILDGLEKMGFLRRVNDSDDRRAINVELTPQGDKLMRKVLPTHFQNVAKLMSGITEAERKALASISKKIAKNLEAAKVPAKAK